MDESLTTFIIWRLTNKLQGSWDSWQNSKPIASTVVLEISLSSTLVRRVLIALRSPLMANVSPSTAYSIHLYHHGWVPNEIAACPFEQFFFFFEKFCVIFVWLLRNDKRGRDRAWFKGKNSNFIYYPRLCLLQGIFMVIFVVSSRYFSSLSNLKALSSFNL